MVNTALTVPASPSITLTSPIETTGVLSSFEIVPRPTPSPIVPPTGFERVTV